MQAFDIRLVTFACKDYDLIKILGVDNAEKSKKYRFSLRVTQICSKSDVLKRDFLNCNYTLDNYIMRKKFMLNK